MVACRKEEKGAAPDHLGRPSYHGEMSPYVTLTHPERWVGAHVFLQSN